MTVDIIFDMINKTDQRFMFERRKYMNQKEKSLIAKNKIMSAAAKLFSEKGYDETTMQDIMQISGLSKGAIYHYFNSKQEILDFLLNFERESVANYLKALVENRELTAKEKIEDVITYLSTNEALPELTKEKWVEKVPFALQDMLKNTLNVLAGYVTEILEQGNRNNEFNCKFPNELAGVLVLLIDIWLDPTIVNSDYTEMCRKVDFIIVLLEKFDTPLFSNDKCIEIKEGLRRYYV